jgi:DisA bacterial checkpoint controller nucleotide-binding
MDPHYYPPAVATALQARWPATGWPLPAPALLAQLVSVAYQASLLQEEGRPVQCRLVYAPPLEAIGAAETCSYDWLAFERPVPCTAQELRRLSPILQEPTQVLAVGQDTSQPTPSGELFFWGLLLTRPLGDPDDGTPSPRLDALPALLLHVRQPGTIVFYCGATRLLTLEQGHIADHGFVQFPQAWIAGQFRERQAQLLALGPRAFNLIDQLGRQLLYRVVARVRAAGHGGMLVMVPSAAGEVLLAAQQLLRPKYPVRAQGHGLQFLDLLHAMRQRLEELGDDAWAQFPRTGDAQLTELNRQLERLATLLASLMAVDGALVLREDLAILGFGVEVRAPFVAADQEVYRALDLEATQLAPVAFDSGGTRHRAAYRLCQAAAECVVVVVSQDGAVKFVRQHQGRVVFWDQLLA